MAASKAVTASVKRRSRAGCHAPPPPAGRRRGVVGPGARGGGGRVLAPPGVPPALPRALGGRGPPLLRGAFRAGGRGARRGGGGGRVAHGTAPFGLSRA